MERTEAVGIILRRGVRVTAVGVACGIAIAAGLERLMAAIVPGLESLKAAAIFKTASVLLLRLNKACATHD